MEGDGMKLVSNAFALSMLSVLPANVKVETLTLADARSEAKTAVSVVGHEDTAAVFSEQLGMSVPMNRTTVTLNPGDVLIVGQYIGQRLPEGTKVLPAGATIKWLKVTV